VLDLDSESDLDLGLSLDLALDSLSLVSDLGLEFSILSLQGNFPRAALSIILSAFLSVRLVMFSII
jgi:hypothetical protein